MHIDGELPFMTLSEKGGALLIQKLRKPTMKSHLSGLYK
jgi:hypothetical protein